MTDSQFPQASPHGPVPPVPVAPGYTAPTAPSYPAPAAPTYQAPPGAYPAPVGGYSAPAGAYQAPAPAQPKSSALGIVAFALSIVAAVVAPIIGGAAAYQIGYKLPSVTDQLNESTNDLSFLAPVRDQVLMGEISFWLGTLTGIAAIVLGIMAIAKRAGRAWGITALILGVIGPLIFFTVVGVTLGLGASSGAVGFYAS